MGVSETERNGMGAAPQVFGREATFENLKNLVNRFLKGEQSDFNLAFDQYVKLAENEFNGLLGDYGSTSEYIDEVNGVLVHQGEYVYYVGEKEIGPGEVIIYLKKLHVTYHIEDDNGKRMYVIHSVKGTSDEEGWDTEKDDEPHYLFYNDFVYLVLASDIVDEVNKLVTKGCITEEQAKAINNGIYRSLVTISDGSESEAEVARRHLEELSKSIHDKHKACASREG